MRRNAEARLSAKHDEAQRTPSRDPDSAPDANRLLHELQVYQVELEMQNEELQASRDRAETLLEKYTDLYDFAPIGYFSLEENSQISEVNLTGATMLGVERSKLISRPFSRFVSASSRPDFLDFLKRIIEGTEKQVRDVTLIKACGTPFWAGLHGLCVNSPDGAEKSCRITVSDITSRKQAEETRRNIEVLAASNQELKQEITKRLAVEKSLRNSEQRQSQLLQQLRTLSHRTLQIQEEERKRISRELHDEISQILVGINMRLESLSQHSITDPDELKKKITATQQLVEKSVDRVHQFARALRPSALDDLGLIVTLKVSFAEFTERTKTPITFTACPEVEALHSDKRTVIYRIIQEALTNVSLHAQASTVNIHISKTEDGIGLEVADDGQSFKVEQVLSDPKNKRLGLIGMRERAEMVGGTFRIESIPEQGTTIYMNLPFHSGNKETTHR